MEYGTAAWLIYILVVTRESKQDHERKLFEVLSKLEKAGYRASKKKSEIFLKQTKCLGHEIDENRIKPNEETVKVILKLKPPTNAKELKSFLGAIQYLEKFVPPHSEKKTKHIWKTTEKIELWKWGEDQETDFNRNKQKSTEKLVAVVWGL